ncbi:hypothetical protein GCM10009841_05310 [Microlunatus panaciterrae]|uniref:ATP-binding cassette subfamily C protein CydC n=1 Tax=Microlunatus panaciterrae TaxID=400768 RepID=A0ABS2RJG6_9ACTN|nr:thiol reductant ABC exporter subunit CydC [Microlunatus panaciterrae]MBM7798813.1 ATP-binding cassette subfamily C protein CydC [Microlunatus panaciterrae]
MKRTRLAAAIGLSALANTAGIGLMGTSAWLLSRAAEQPPVLYLMVAIVTVRALGLGRGVFRYLERLVGHQVALGSLTELRVRVYRRLTGTTLLGRDRGDLLARVTADVDAVVDLVVRVLVPAVSAALVTVATTVVLGALSPAAGVVVLVSALLAGWLVPLLSQWLARHADASLAPCRGELATALTEATGAATDLLAYGADEDMLRRVQQIDGRLRRAEARTAAIQGVAAGCQLLAAGGAVLGSLLVGARGVADGSLRPVYLAVLVLTPIALHEVLGTLIGVAHSWTRTRTALARVTDVLAAEPVGTGDRELPPRSSKGRLHAERLSVGWPGSLVLQHRLDLELGPGDRACLVGPSGSGKTTVAATLLGLIPARGGRVEVSGRVGYLAQDAYLFDTSVAENVRIGNRDATDDEIRVALDRVGLDLELDRLVGQHGVAVSGGEARRVALARLLVGAYDVVILDEPTEHLDADTADRLMRDVWDLFVDAVVLVITHDPAVIAATDVVVSTGAGLGVAPTVDSCPSCPAIGHRSCSSST